MKINLLRIVIVFLLIFTLTSCEGINIFNNQPNTNDMPENMEKSEDIYLDYIWFKILSIETKQQEYDGHQLNIVDVEIIQNFNNIINIETDYSKYIDEKTKNNEKIKISFSDTYFKYLNIDDEFIYKLDDLVYLKNKNITQIVFDTFNNEFTLLPIKNEELCFNNNTTSMTCDDDYVMNTIVLERYVHYGIDFDHYFVEYDYSIGYGDYECLILYTGRNIERFEKTIKAFNNINNSHFYKLKYSDLITIFDPAIANYVDDYLVEIGGLSNESN